MFKKYPSIQAFISYISTFKTAFWGTAAVFAVSNVIIMLIPWLIGGLTGSLQRNGPIVLWTAALIASSIGHDATWRLGEILYLKLLNARSHRFDDHVFEAIIQYPYAFFVDKFTGKISSHATSLGREFRELLSGFYYEYIGLIVAIPITAAIMFTVNSYTGYIFVGSLGLMFITGQRLAKLVAAAEKAESDERSTVDGHTVDAIANFVSVKAFGSERREARRLSQKRSVLIAAANNSYFKNILFWGLMSLFIRWVIWPSTFILNVYLFTQGRIDLAQMTTFLTAIVLFSNFIWEVIWSISQLNIKLARIEEAYRYLFGTRNIFADIPANSASKQSSLLAPNVPKPAAKLFGQPQTTQATTHTTKQTTKRAIKQAEGIDSPTFTRSLELRHLSFAYPDQPQIPVLSDINLTIKKGERIGVVGPSGGGKSTLIKLLLGYYPVQPGQLLMDDKEVVTRSLTDIIAYVPQDTAVFHRSIRENILYGRPDASDEEVVAAAKHAQAHEFIASLQSGYETLVGERGVKLSGGQRQRIAIARALLKDAPLLMLDEATSALDSESEKLIQRALQDLFRGRTAIVIAHRLSTIQHMDRIVVFDKGRIIEEGTHAQLLRKNGTYAKLWAHQSGGFIEE